MAAGRVELPPKPGIHPREDAFIHAMPAYLADSDVASIKWVGGYPANKERGLPYISGLIVVNDAETGFPLAVMDAAEITAARTAAASGVCIRHWAPEGWSRAAIVGCGEQGKISLPGACGAQSRRRDRAPTITTRSVTADLEGRVKVSGTDGPGRGRGGAASSSPLISDCREASEPLISSEWPVSGTGAPTRLRRLDLPGRTHRRRGPLRLG